MASKYRYQLTQNAVNDLDDIVNYIVHSLGNPQAASDFMDSLQKVIEKTCSFPESGPMVENEFLTNIGVRKKLVDNYIMYYLPDDDAEIIRVLRVVYGRRNMNQILKKLDS